MLLREKRSWRWSRYRRINYLVKTRSHTVDTHRLTESDKRSIKEERDPRAKGPAQDNQGDFGVVGTEPEVDRLPTEPVAFAAPAGRSSMKMGLWNPFTP